MPLTRPSSRTRASCGCPRPRRRPSTWTRPWLPAAPAGRAAARMPSTAHMCSSHCMSTSTAWRSVARAEVGVTRDPGPSCSCHLGVSPSPSRTVPWGHRLGTPALGWGCRALGGGHATTPCSLVSVSGGRSRLHLIDLGSCEGAPGRGGEAPGGPLCLSLSALGSVILALLSGAKHVPHR